MAKKKLSFIVPLIAVGTLGVVGATVLLAKKSSAQTPQPSQPVQPPQPTGTLDLTVNATRIDIFGSPNVPTFTITNNTTNTLTSVDLYVNNQLFTSNIVSQLAPTLWYTFTQYRAVLNQTVSYYVIGKYGNNQTVTSNIIYVSYFASR